jgi:hypothetical protein
MAQECYDLAATPPPNTLYRQAVDEVVGSADYTMPSEARLILLQIGLDVKCIVLGYLAELEDNHGDKRAIKLANWIHDGRISHLSYYQRCELLADRKRLKRKIDRYRGRR